MFRFIELWVYQSIVKFQEMVDGVSEVSREKNLSGWINLEC